MATKREIVSQLKAADLKVLADAAEAGIASSGKALGVKLELSPKDTKAVKRAVKILRTVRTAAG